MISRISGAALAALVLMATPAVAQSANSTSHGNANAPGALMTTCPTQQNGHKSDTQGNTGSTSGSGPQANQTTRSSTGINGQTTCPDGTIPPSGTTSANGGQGA